MHFASYFLCLLLISISFPIYNCKQLIERVSGDENDNGNHIFTIFRFLLGFSPLGTRTQKLSFSPSPAPAPTEEYVAPPLHHKSYHGPVLGSNDRAKAPRRKIILIASISAAVAVLVLGVTLLIVCKWWRLRKKALSTKVSYDPDPGPETFYLDSLATVLEVESKNALSASTICSSDEMTDTKSSPTFLKRSESVTGCRSRRDSDAASCLDEGISRSDDESFHSLCYLSPDEMIQSCTSTMSSPSSSEFKPNNFPPIKPPLLSPLPSPQSKRPFPLVTNKSHFNPSPKFKVETSQISMPKEENSSKSPKAKLICANATVSKLEAKLPPMPPPPPPPPPLPTCGPSANRLPPPPPPPPPPSPGFPPQSAAVGKDGTPLPKLKALHWAKVRATPDRSMVWDKIRSSSFELDEQMIESLFRHNIQNNAKTEDAKNKSSSPVKNVLDHKRLQNITILMKAVNATTEQVCEALKQGRGLSAQQLEALVKMMPTKEEEEKIFNFTGDVTELGSAEIFLKEILNIQFAFSRIQVMLFRETFEDEVVHLKKSFAMLEEACQELRSSRLFFRLLEAVLKTGNRMNVGTVRGGARAFKLDTLLKLADVKGTDGKTTLLHFVVQEIIRSEGFDIVLGLSDELCNVKRTASVDLEVLASSVSNLSEGMYQLKKLIEVDIPINSFANSMRLFTIRTEKAIKKLKDDEDRVLVRVREITEYYHGDVSKEEANPLRIFVIVRDFLAMLDRVCKEIGSSKTYQSTNSVATFR